MADELQSNGSGDTNDAAPGNTSETTAAESTAAESNSDESARSESSEDACSTPASPASGGSSEMVPEPESPSWQTLATAELVERRDALQKEIQELSQRKQQLEQDLRQSFAGQSDAIARRVKGFQEYLGGALQDLAQSVESLELVVQPMVVQPSPLDHQISNEPSVENVPTPAIADTFKPDEELIRASLQGFLEQPDFYAGPWKLRRSLDGSDVALLEDWFFNQGGRGAQASRGSRPRNVLLASGLIAIIGELYGDQFQTLVLAGQPERLGDWRRGLQDCLGLGREDFGPNSGIVLFDRADALVERADRLEERGEVPLILIDAAERAVDIPVLQFPLWLAFAAQPDELLIDDDLL